jgi:hypothetical protein
VDNDRCSTDVCHYQKAWVLVVYTETAHGMGGSRSPQENAVLIGFLMTKVEKEQAVRTLAVARARELKLL